MGGKNRLTEKEKRAAGELYCPIQDPELMSELMHCKDLCQQYNQMPHSDVNGRRNLLSEILTSTGENICIEPSFWCDFGYNISVGDNFFANHNLVILDCAKINFGSNVLVGPNCAFYTVGHPLNVEQRAAGLEYAQPITIGNNVWFGGNVVVLMGVTIGNNCVIGAGSVVTQSIPDNCVVAGVPAKVIKRVESVG